MKRTVLLSILAILFCCILCHQEANAGDKWQVQLSGNPWVDKIGTTIFAPFRFVLIPVRLCNSSCRSQRSGVGQQWDVVKSAVNQDIDYAENLAGAALNILTPWTSRNFTHDWGRNTPVARWAEKSDIANVVKIVALGTTFGYLAAEVPVFSHHIANDLGAMHGISVGAQLTTRSAFN